MGATDDNPAYHTSKPPDLIMEEVSDEVMEEGCGSGRGVWCGDGCGGGRRDFVMEEVSAGRVIWNGRAGCGHGRKIR